MCVFPSLHLSWSDSSTPKRFNPKTKILSLRVSLGQDQVRLQCENVCFNIRWAPAVERRSPQIADRETGHKLFLIKVGTRHSAAIKAASGGTAAGWRRVHLESRKMREKKWPPVGKSPVEDFVRCLHQRHSTKTRLSAVCAKLLTPQLLLQKVVN